MPYVDRRQLTITWMSNIKEVRYKTRLHVSVNLIAELREGPPSGAPYSYRKEKETHELISHGCHGQQHCSWAHTHDDDDGVAQHGGHTPNNRLIETCSLGLSCTSLILDIHVVIN